MPGRLKFAISIIGRDLWWDGVEITPDFGAAILYDDFATADAEVGNVVLTQGPLYGNYAFEVRPIMFGI